MYHAIHIVDSYPPVYVAFESIPQLQDWFHSLYDKSGYLYIFSGSRLLTTGGPFPYLIEGDQNHPLFRIPLPGTPVDEACLDELLKVDSTYQQLTPVFEALPEEEAS